MKRPSGLEKILEKYRVVSVILTPEEAEVLWNLMAYGWADGEYKGLLEKEEAKLVIKAMKKYQKAYKKAFKKGHGRH